MSFRQPPLQDLDAAHERLDQPVDLRGVRSQAVNIVLRKRDEFLNMKEPRTEFRAG